jgi:hypothetical protein
MMKLDGKFFYFFEKFAGALPCHLRRRKSKFLASFPLLLIWLNSHPDIIFGSPPCQ